MCTGQTRETAKTEQRHDTTEGESRTKSPLVSQLALCRRTVTSSKVYMQPPHAALLSSKLANQHIPALSGKQKMSACRSCCNVWNTIGKSNEHFTSSGSTFERVQKQNENAQADTHTFICRRAGMYIGQLWTLIGALRVCLLSSPHQA